MLSSTASPFKRQSMAIPQSMQKLIASLQLQKKSRKLMNGPLSLKYKSFGMKRVNSSVRDTIVDSIRRTTDSSARNPITKNAPATGVIAVDNSFRNSPSDESSLQNYNSFKKRKLLDGASSTKGIECRTAEKTGGSIVALNAESSGTLQANVDSTSRNPTSSLDTDDDVIYVECSSDLLIPTNSSRVKQSFRPETGVPDEFNNESTKSKSIKCHEISENRSSLKRTEKSTVAFLAEEKLDSSDELFITDPSEKTESTISRRVNVPDECTRSATIDLDKISKSIISENTTNSGNVAPATAAKVDDDACGFITFNNIMQFSKRGCFTNDLFSDDGDDERNGSVPEFQDKGVQVPDESMLQAGNDICEELRPLIQKVRALNDMIRKAREQITNFSIVHPTSDVGEV